MLEFIQYFVVIAGTVGPVVYGSMIVYDYISEKSK
jgi:hypothetical protein